MKKVFVLLAATTLLAGPAFGAIDGSKHDLASYQTGTSTETCVYCHTPHGADTTVTNAPLWNRDISAVSVSAVYAGANLKLGHHDCHCRGDRRAAVPVLP